MTNKEKEKRIRDNARRYIIDLENQGFSVPQGLKDDLWDANGNPIDYNRVTTQRLTSDKSRFSTSSIRSKAQLSITQARSKTAAEAYDIDPVSLNITLSKNFAPTINAAIDRLQQLRETEGYKVSKMNFGNDLALFTSRLSGEEPKPGADNENYTISANWDGNYNTLLDNIVFKKITLSGRDDKIYIVDAVKRLFTNTPYANEEVQERFENNWREHSLKTNMERIADELNNEYGTSVTANELLVLRNVMDMSSAWHIAKRGAEDSEQAKERFKTLIKCGKEIEAVGTTADWNELCTMIDNEVDFDTIIDFVDDILSK